MSLTSLTGWSTPCTVGEAYLTVMKPQVKTKFKGELSGSEDAQRQPNRCKCLFYWRHALIGSASER